MRTFRRFPTAWILLLTGGIILIYQIDWKKTETVPSLSISDAHLGPTGNVPSLGDSEPLYTGTGSRVLIYSRWRSGSSFLGDLFSSHPDVFYIYEPLKMFDTSSRKMSEHWFETAGLGYLAEILNCNFSFIFDIPISALENKYQARKKFRTTFCRQEACQNVRKLERKCRNRKHVVVKTIKTHSIELLDPFTQRGVRVIHLVRDPRSWLWSQYKLKEFQAGVTEYDKTAQILLENLVTRNLSERCTSISRDLQPKPRQDVLQRPYTLRFEDLAASPLHYTHKLYNFLGIKLHPNVIQFIAKATNYTGSDLDRPYSTKRNSTQVLERWRQEMPWKMVKRIQEVCSVVMETLHYSPAVNKSMLRDLSVELTRPDFVS